MSEEEAWGWPDLMQIVEEKVKPTRLKDNRALYRKYWWQYAEKRIDLYKTIHDLEYVLARSLTSKHFAFTFLPQGMVYDQTLIIFAQTSWAFFAAISSRVHESWCAFFGATLEDRPRYNIADCFETFSFPENFEINARLEAIGKEYYEFRAQLMVANNEGLTKTYNRFHDAPERSPEIKKLRELHDAMDRTVLDAYGWTDLVPTCEFLLDYEEDEGDEDSSSRRRKPWRYRWPDDIRDEVLARLLELNKQRAEQEHLAGLAAEAAAGMPQGRKKLSSTATSRRKQSAPNTAQPDLLGR